MAEKSYTVTGAAVVLPTSDGSERYLYHGAAIPAGAYTADGIKRALENKLISEAPESVDHDAAVEAARAEAAASTAPSEEWTHAQLDAYATDRSYEVPTGNKAEKVAALAELDKAAATAAAAQ